LAKSNTEINFMFFYLFYNVATRKI